MKLKQGDLSHICINDKFWKKHIDLVESTIIPYQWEIMNDRIPGAQSSHCLDNFKIAAGRMEGAFYGAVFQDTDIAKWLEAVGFTLATHKNKDLERLADKVIDLIADAQQEDGYMDTYFIIKEPDMRWKNLCEGHELYTAGHMIEAAVAYYKGTGKRKLLDCVIKLADLICDTFGSEEGKIHGYPGHQEIELALVKLAGITGQNQYMDMAKYFLDIRGVGENYFIAERKQSGFRALFPELADYDPAYSQSHKPVRRQETAEGHAVRAVYMYSAMADIAEAYKDEELLSACRKLWNNIVEKRMYITGGIGSSGFLERFTADYDLPNDCNYSETCASIGMAMFGIRMANITGESKYADIVELELYNNILAGAALDGKSFFYVNPLRVKPEFCMEHTSKAHVKSVRQKWFGVACCPPNIARTFASLGQYIYGIGGNDIYIHLFIANRAELSVQGQEVQIEIETEMPWKGNTRIHIRGVKKKINLYIRIPEYAENCRIYSENAEAAQRIDKGYACLELEKNTDIRICFDFSVRFLRANTEVDYNIGRTVLKRGPIVYCFEELDNGKNLDTVFLDTREEPKELYDEGLGGVIKLLVRGKRMINRPEKLYSEYTPQFEDVICTAIPYAYWDNRGAGEMAVWMNTVMAYD